MVLKKTILYFLQDIFYSTHLGFGNSYYNTAVTPEYLISPNVDGGEKK